MPIFTLNLEPGRKLSDALKLISQRKLSERHRDFSGNTPLHTACVHGQLDVVKLLTREIGCDPNNTTEVCRLVVTNLRRKIAHAQLLVGILN